jgi:DNA-binding LytR/AlgR family response regulator
MEDLRIIIVDDEPLALDIMETYCSKIDGLMVVSRCKNALEAFSILSKEHIDIMLLDIEMPEINGMDFLKALKNPPLVIFTTAYSQFAIESYEHNSVDYLLKPVSFERFLKAINKVTSIIKSSNSSERQTVNSEKNAPSINTIIFVKSEGKLIKINLGEVWLIEGLKDYAIFRTEKDKIIVHSTMKSLEDQLLKLTNFVRIHKSYIINLTHVTEVWGNSIKIKDEMITIGSTYRDEVNKLFEEYKLS